jgi:hypothetical protein
LGAGDGHGASISLGIRGSVVGIAAGVSAIVVLAAVEAEDLRADGFGVLLDELEGGSGAGDGLAGL